MKTNQISKTLATACLAVISLASTTINSTAWARGGGGGHSGGGHCSGHSFSGGHSFSHVSCTHTSSIHSFCSHASTSHTSMSPVIGLTRCSSPSNILDASSHIRFTTSPTMFLQSSPATSCSTPVSSMVRRNSHCGLLGHLHRIFCSPAQIATVVSDTYFIQRQQQQQNDFSEVPMNESAVEITHSAPSTLERQIDTTQAETDANTTEQTLHKLSVSSVLITDKLPAMALFMDTNAPETASGGEPIFKGLSYMLPNPGGILDNCFAQKNSLQRFFLKMEDSYLWFAMHHLP